MFQARFITAVCDPYVFTVTVARGGGGENRFVREDQWPTPGLLSLGSILPSCPGVIGLDQGLICLGIQQPSIATEPQSILRVYVSWPTITMKPILHFHKKDKIVDNNQFILDQFL